VVKLLVAKGAFVDSQDAEGCTPVHDAAAHDHEEVITFLLSVAAAVEPRDIDGRTPLHRAAAIDGHVNVARVLIQAGADVNAKDHIGLTPLHFAAARGCPDVAKELIANGAGVNALDKRWVSPLHMAAHGGHNEVAVLLIKSGAEVNAISGNGKSAMSFAKEAGNDLMVVLLARYGGRLMYDARSIEERQLEIDAYAGTSLGPEVDTLVTELIQIGRTDGYLCTDPHSMQGKFDEKNRHIRAREIAEALNTRGGISLMRAAHYRVQAALGSLCARYLEVAWGYIGDWLP
jgi:ankyrin repeat protein